MTLTHSRWRDLPFLIHLMATNFPFCSERRIVFYCREYRRYTQVLFVDGRRVGAVICTPEHNQGMIWIEYIAINPQFRRLGLADRLLAIVERDAAAAGFARVALGVDGCNEAALRLYGKNGYAGEAEDNDRWLFSKTIDPRGPIARPAPQPRNTILDWPSRVLARIIYRIAIRAMMPSRG